MREIIERNLAYLEKAFPPVYSVVTEAQAEPACVYVQGSQPNLVYKKRHFHAPRNPRQEAQALIEDLTVRAGALYIFMGVGLGYHIARFKELHGDLLPEITIVCLERCVSAFRELVYHKDISFLEGTHLFVGNESERIVELIRDLDPLSFSGYRIVKLRGGYSLFESYYSEIEAVLKELLSGSLSDLLTMFAFDSLWMKNTIDNTPRLIGKSSILPLKDIAKGSPALVVGAGPSLRSQLETIKGTEDRIVIITVDTALETLLAAGIHPDFVVSIDAQYPNFLDFFSSFMGEPVRRKTVLISDIIVYPQILRHWTGPLFFSTTAHPAGSVSAQKTPTVSFFTAADGIYRDAHPIVSKFKSFYGPAGWLRCGGSVATTALEFAIHVGADPVLLTGLDFAYTGYMTHVTSAPSYNLYLGDSHRFNPLPTSFVRRLNRRKLVHREGNRGGNVLSDFIFQNYLSWFGRTPLQRRDEYRGRVFNATYRGARIPGIEWVELDKFIREYQGMQKKPAIMPDRKSHTLQKPAACRFLLSVKREIDDARETVAGREASEDLKSILINRYPFLQNSVALTYRLFGGQKEVQANLLLLLSMLEQRADRALESLETT